MCGRRRRLLGALLCAGVSHVAPGGALGAQVEVSGQVGVEARFFPEAPTRSEQPRWVSTSAVARPEVTAALGDRLAFRAIARGRLDQSDGERTYVDLREALLQWDRGALTVTIGVNTVFWGVAESRHLVDIVNQTDYVEDLDGEEKLGQPMALVTYYFGDLGILDLLAMTWARSQRYPGMEGRPGVPLPVFDDAPEWESEREEWNVDLAARWSHGLGELNWGLSFFRGTARDPQLLPVVGPDGPGLRPRYDLIRQAGLEVQWTHGGWLWKAEGLVRAGQGPTFAAVTGGFEYTVFGVLQSALDLGIIAEYSYDGRDNLTYNVYDSDVFGGLRLSFNDAEGTEVLAGVLQDAESAVTLGSLEASRRLGAGWRGEVVARWFRAGAPEDPVHWFRKDDYLEMTLEYYF